MALIPTAFFDAAQAREILSRTVSLQESDEVEYISLPEYSAVLVYSFSSGSNPEGVVPEMYLILKDLQELEDHNRIVASYSEGYLHLAIAQGKNLLLANVYEAADFTTAEYFIFMALRKLQMNPEVSSIHFRTPLSGEEEMSLYRYFKSVEHQ